MALDKKILSNQEIWNKIVFRDGKMSLADMAFNYGDEFAQQRAIGFAEWIEKDYFFRYDDKLWYDNYYQDFSIPDNIKGLTIAELYTLYINQL